MEIQYRLESIAETEFKIDFDFDYSRFEQDKLSVQIGHKYTPDMDNDRLSIEAVAVMVYGDEEIQLARNSVRLTFGLVPIREIIKLKEDGSLSSKNNQVIDTFIIATIGTLRGTMLKNLKGTPLAPYFIPLIPIENFKVSPK